ncbi:MAG: membrane protease YdiL (CAAX protease family) [Gammaproteobacteria bacterium]|jgi:membrane protease YdiL (CAAX protease family)
MGSQLRPKALLVLVIAALLTISATSAISPGIVVVLKAMGVAEVQVDEIAIRTLELMAIAATVVALVFLGGGGKAAWGIAFECAVVRRLSVGFVCGVLSLGLVCVVLYAFDVRVVRHDLPLQFGYWFEAFASAMLSAVVVGVLEEVWFRGGLLTLLRRCSGVALAVFGGSVFYAATHFLAIPGGLNGSDEHQFTTFQLLQAAAQNMFQLQHLDSFVALCIAGVTLALIRLRQGDVAMCIGIHVGWVLTIKLFKKLTYVSPSATNRFLAGQYDDVIGWVAAASLAIMFVLVWRFVRPRASLAVTQPASEGERK